MAKNKEKEERKEVAKYVFTLTEVNELAADGYKIFSVDSVVARDLEVLRYPDGRKPRYLMVKPQYIVSRKDIIQLKKLLL